MKKLTLVPTLFIIAVNFLGCDSDESKPNAEQKFLQQLAFTWNLQQVKADDNDVTLAFNNLSLVLSSNKSFNVINAVDPIWPVSGTFTLEEITGSIDYNVIRSDGTVIRVTELSSAILKLQFQYLPTGGKVSSIEGQYEFSFTR